MRLHPVLILVVGVSLSACSDDPAGDLSGGPVGPSTGTLVVSTSTVGDDPDPDGYVLTVDDANPFDLNPTGTREVDLPSGQHTLRLLGVADHCTVTPGTPVEVDISAGTRTPATFEVTCPATGARITTATTGQDPDPDGYGVVVDGTDRGTIPSNGTMLIRLDPGSRTISLVGLASNCAIEGSPAHTVTIVTAEVATIYFVVVCTALDPPLTGHIWGQVLNESGVCIRGAMVEIVAGPGMGRKSGQPDPPLCDAWWTEGYHFDDLPLGARVTLRATAQGYQPEDRELRVPAGGYPVQFRLQPNE